MSEKRILAVDSVVFVDRKILLIKRRFDPFRGMWALPGGFVEKNETTKNACIRETKEETGLDVEPVSTLGVYDDPQRDPRGVITIVFLCRVLGGKPTKSIETEDIGFFDKNTALKLKLASDHKEIIKDAFRKIGKKVLVGGAFNIIHPGHIYFLKKARSMGNSLVVVVANDATLLKNKYLLYKAKERKKIVENLKFVDKAVIGDKKDFFKVVRDEKPDIIVLGYDQNEMEIKDGIERSGLHCKVVRIKEKYKSYGTKDILKRIKEL